MKKIIAGTLALFKASIILLNDTSLNPKYNKKDTKTKIIISFIYFMIAL